MIFRKHFFATLLFLPCYAFGQKIIVIGNVVNEQKEALPYASILLFDSVDSSLKKSAPTDTNGAFVLHLANTFTNCFLKITAIGYTEKFIELDLKSKDTFNVNAVLYPSDFALDDILISDKKQLIERKVDRTVFHVENSIAAVGADAFEMLKKTPGVQISNNDINIVGKSSVNIMIDDRLVQVDRSELEALLRSIPASGISRIEVITAPSAKYDAQGNSGILNIVTKKNKKEGFNGNLTASYTQKTKGSKHLDAAFNFRKNQINIYGNASINSLRFISEQQTNTYYPRQEQQQILNQDNRPLYSYNQLGADYTLKSNMILGVLYTFGTWDGKRDELYKTTATALPIGKTDSVLNTNAFAGDRGRRHVINLNYEWNIDTLGKKLTVNADIFSRRGDKKRDFTTANYLSDGNSTGFYSDNKTLGKQITNIKNVRVDLDVPSQILNLSIGMKATFIHNHSDNNFSYLDNGNYVNDVYKTNSFDYKENTQAAYINALKSFGRWTAQVGLRAEYTQTKGVSATLSQSNTNKYFKIFPTAFLQYKHNDNHSWNINYTRRINRPSFWDMNPFRIYTTEVSYEEGNPFLQPSFSNDIELGYAFKSLLSITIFQHKVTDLATRVSRIDTLNNAFNFGQANAGNELRYGLTATFSFSPMPWWESTTQIFGTYNEFSSSYYTATINYSKPSFSIRTDNSFMLNKKQTLQAELGFSYTPSQQSDFDVQREYYALGLAFKALLLQKKLTIALSADDIFKTDIWQMNNIYNGTSQHSYFDNRFVRLAITWKFGNKNIKEKRKRNTNIEDAGRSS